MDEEARRSATISALRRELALAIFTLENSHFEDLSRGQIQETTKFLKLAISEIDAECFDSDH